MMNLANILTLLRLILLPFMVVLFFLPFEWAAWWCLGLYALGSATDFMDGWVARKFNQVSEFGKFMDPISDKIFVVTIMLMLVAVNRIEGLMVLAVVVIIVREFLVSGLREFLGPKNIKMPVTPLAKWKTATQMLALGFLIIGPFAAAAMMAGNLLLLLAAVLTAVTGWNYLKAALPHIGF